MKTIWTHLAVALVLATAQLNAQAGEMKLEMRTQIAQPGGGFKSATQAESWRPAETAVIVCDVWDLHHSINAVRRMEEFLPRMNEVLAHARQLGATIIHAPSDCMPAYAEHPARLRAIKTPTADGAPPLVRQWCSQIPGERQATYPIDQSDGGEDDDPREHAEWAARLIALGRNPGMPWQQQNEQITIDAERDYLSDRGDEVWNILAARGVRNVILLGVHTNMCVLGRPFGLRQMVLGKKNVVLMRDMTDCMYNPKSWPYVDHYTGNRLVIDHVERYVSPTITSDQLLGGEPFRFKHDKGDSEPPRSDLARDDFRRHWSPLLVPGAIGEGSQGLLQNHRGPAWYRCVIRVPENWRGQAAHLTLTASSDAKAWFNGQPLQRSDGSKANEYAIEPAALIAGDANLLVVRLSNVSANEGLTTAPVIRCHGKSLSLAGRWQFRSIDEEKNSNMPLPAKFGAATDIVFDEP